MRLEENKDLSNGQMSAKEVHKSGWKFEKIEDTPFTIMSEEGIWYGLCGNNRITAGYTNREALEEELRRVDWNKITQVIYTMVEKWKQLKEQENG